jgi:hypothetical protein
MYAGLVQTAKLRYHCGQQKYIYFSTAESNKSNHFEHLWTPENIYFTAIQFTSHCREYKTLT